jgi:hypothetical protein
VILNGTRAANSENLQPHTQNGSGSSNTTNPPIAGPSTATPATEQPPEHVLCFFDGKTWKLDPATGNSWRVESDQETSEGEVEGEILGASIASETAETDPVDTGTEASILEAASALANAEVRQACFYFLYLL